MTDLATRIEDAPAFPNGRLTRGMTLRDYFAAQVFGLAAASHISGTTNLNLDQAADDAYAAADAMLRAREQSQ